MQVVIGLPKSQLPLNSTEQREGEGTDHCLSLSRFLPMSPAISPPPRRWNWPIPRSPSKPDIRSNLAVHLVSHGWNCVLLIGYLCGDQLRCSLINYFWALRLETHRLEYILGSALLSLQLCYTLFFFTRLTFQLPSYLVLSTSDRWIRRLSPVQQIYHRPSDIY